MLLTLKNIYLAFDRHALLDSVDFTIKEKEKAGLIGRNGAGKSTLLKIIAGQLIPDKGEVHLQKGKSTGYLSQDIPVLSGTIYENIASSFEPEGKYIIQYHQQSLSDNPDETILAEANAYLDSSDAWSKIKQIDIFISRLGLDPDAYYEKLSIGQKRRVLLARELARDPDILLLDEPTNHLDISSILWLEEYLSKYQKSLLLVTHDRSFLESVTNIVYELDRGNLITFNCSYKEYVQRKNDMIGQEEEENRKFDKKLANEEAWLRQGIKARRTRNEGRVRTLEKLREERSRRRELLSKGSFSLQKAVKSGKKVIEADNISFSYKDKNIIKDFSTIIMRDDKVAILGNNGCGKTTLIKLLLKEITPQKGKVELGTKLTISYFDQSRLSLDPELTLFESISEGSDMVIFNGSHIHIYTYLQSFLFTKDQVQKKVKSLSGGEKNRLLLAKMFSKPSNLLVLDEPTNDLDTETLELLESMLADFKGTVIVVSHDRTFINNIASSSIIFHRDGSVIEYAGGYENWQPEEDIGSKKPAKIKKEKKQKSKERKISFNEKRELDDLPRIIEELEEEQNNLINRMATPEFFKQSSEEIKKEQKMLNDLNILLEQKYERWCELEELNSR